MNERARVEAALDERMAREDRYRQPGSLIGMLLSVHVEQGEKALTLDLVTTYMRAAYGLGYVDAIADDGELLVTEPLVAFPELLLP